MSEKDRLDGQELLDAIKEVQKQMDESKGPRTRIFRDPESGKVVCASRDANGKWSAVIMEDDEDLS